MGQSLVQLTVLIYTGPKSTLFVGFSIQVLL